ncbi:MAG: Uma2 family endonuclease [Bacteroidota bacterium]
MFREEIATIDDVLVESPTIETDYEIKRGKPMPSFNHAYVQSNTTTALRNKYKHQFTILPELDLDLPNATKPTVPDICIFPKREGNLSKDILKVKDPPLTTIEIVSPSQTLDEMKDKIFQNYFPAGVKSAWLIIPPARAVVIYTPDKKFKTYVSGEFTDPATGITLAVDEVFEDLE